MWASLGIFLAGRSSGRKSTLHKAVSERTPPFPGTHLSQGFRVGRVERDGCS